MPSSFLNLASSLIFSPPPTVQGVSSSYSFSCSYFPAWDSSQRRQSSMKFSSASPSHWDTVLHNLLQCVSSTGFSPSRGGCSSASPWQDHKPCPQTWCSGLLSPWSSGPTRKPPSGVHLLWCGVLNRLQRDINSLKFSNPLVFHIQYRELRQYTF